jgi:hypothetical protein
MLLQRAKAIKIKPRIIQDGRSLLPSAGADVVANGVQNLQRVSLAASDIGELLHLNRCHRERFGDSAGGL